MHEDISGEITAHLNKIAELIHEHGWAVQGVVGSDGSDTYAYTVGLSFKDLPELVLRGLDYNVSANILNDVASAMIRGQRIMHGSTVEIANGYSLTAVEVDDEHLHTLAVAETMSITKISALQLVWPDAGHKLPWDPDFDSTWSNVPVLSSKVPPTPPAEERV